MYYKFKNKLATQNTLKQNDSKLGDLHLASEISLVMKWSTKHVTYSSLTPVSLQKYSCKKMKKSSNLKPFQQLLCTILKCSVNFCNSDTTEKNKYQEGPFIALLEKRQQPDNKFVSLLNQFQSLGRISALLGILFACSFRPVCDQIF